MIFVPPKNKKTVYLDFSKTFDSYSVPHSKLLMKLLGSLEIYEPGSLTYRYQCVSVNGCLSLWSLVYHKAAY